MQGNGTPAKESRQEDALRGVFFCLIHLSVNVSLAAHLLPSPPPQRERRLERGNGTEEGKENDMDFEEVLERRRSIRFSRRRCVRALHSTILCSNVVDFGKEYSHDREKQEPRTRPRRVERLLPLGLLAFGVYESDDGLSRVRSTATASS